MAPSSGPRWVTLTELGHRFGISAVQCGRLLHQAGLRDHNGRPSARALHEQLAYGSHGAQPSRQYFWNAEGCSLLLGSQGLVARRPPTLVEQWAELLSALVVGSPSISTSAEQMAEDLPQDLVEPVNSQLRANGCSFQVPLPEAGVRSGGGLPPACSSAPAKPSNGLRRYG